MKKDSITEKEKMQIISECINTKKLYRTIAKEHNLNIEEFYEIINEYCKNNNYTSFIRGIRAFEKEDGTVVRKNKNKEIIIKVNGKGIDGRRERLLKETKNNVQELENWFDRHGRLPRAEISRS